MAYTIDAAHLRQIDVHEHHIRLVTRDFLQSILRRPMTTHKGKTMRPLQLMRQLFAHDIIIFHHANAHRPQLRRLGNFRFGADHLHDSALESPFPPITLPCNASRGTNRRTVVPLPPALFSSNRPPMPSKRRRILGKPLPSRATESGLKPLPLSAIKMFNPSSSSCKASRTSV